MTTTSVTVSSTTSQISGIWHYPSIPVTAGDTALVVTLPNVIEQTGYTVAQGPILGQAGQTTAPLVSDFTVLPTFYTKAAGTGWAVGALNIVKTATTTATVTITYGTAPGVSCFVDLIVIHN